VVILASGQCFPLVYSQELVASSACLKALGLSFEVQLGHLLQLSVGLEVAQKVQREQTHCQTRTVVNSTKPSEYIQ